MKIKLIALVTLALTSCIKPSTQQDAGNRGSKLVSVSMKMPSKIGDKDVTGKLDFYELKIKKTGGDCSFVDIEKSEKISSPDVKIDASLKQGCDYLVALQFGLASADGKKLEKIYLTNEAHDGLAANPKLVKKEELVGKSSMTIQNCVSVTKLGATYLGVDAAECPSIANDNTDAMIEPQFPNLGSSGVKLVDKIKAEIKSVPAGTPASLFIEGKIQSTHAKDQYCAILHAVILENKDFVYAEHSEGLIKIEANMELNVSTTVTKMTEDQRADKAAGHQLFVKCFETDSPTMKTADLMKECRTANTCKELK